jgi:hypothetical protein
VVKKTELLTENIVNMLSDDRHSSVCFYSNIICLKKPTPQNGIFFKEFSPSFVLQKDKSAECRVSDCFLLFYQ